MNDAVSQFREAMQVAGLMPPEVMEPGKLLRFAGAGKRPANRAGWCVLFADGLGGCFGDWSSGLSATWQADGHKPISRTERAVFARQVEAARRRVQTENRARQFGAADRAAGIWKAAKLAPADHPYLIRKCIRPHGAKIYKGALMLPVMDFAGNLTSLQFIAANGRKLLLSGGRKQGCVIPVAGDWSKPCRVVICEGWATGCTLAEDEPATLMLAAIDAGNLEPVAVGARCRWPTTELIIAGDDDRLTAGNPGANKAKAAAIASGALLALPQWPKGAPEHLTDFNDLAVWTAGGEA